MSRKMSDPLARLLGSRSLKEVAAELGRSRASIWAWANGRRPAPLLERDLARLLGVRIDHIRRIVRR